MPIVRKDSLDAIIWDFKKVGQYALDTETTGLRPHLGDSLFSIILAGPGGSFYFNFQAYGSTHDAWTLDKKLVFPKLQEIFNNPDSLWFMHNAKFDLAMLAKDGMNIHGRVHCTEVTARLLYNSHFEYSLGSCAKRIGLEKSKAVDEYIKRNKLYTKVETLTGSEDKQPHFDKVPFEIITEYGLKDGEITRTLGLSQLLDLERHNQATPGPLPRPQIVYENEIKLVKTCFRMEQTGIKIDRQYSQRAFDYETTRAKLAAAEFSRQTGIPFVDSAMPLSKAFDAAGESYPRTPPTKTRPQGTPSFTDAVLETFTTPLAKLLREYRDASKKANTYYANFLRFADTNDRIHANMRQAGTATGRFSYGEPNLQNLTKDEDTTKEFLVRRAFVPSADYCLVMIDYDQMEYRLMLDYANEKEVIKQIVDNGLDVHEATAKQMGVTRTQAKTLNFLLLYGGGVLKLATALGIDEPKARQLRQDYFAKLPQVRTWSKLVVERAGNQQRQIVNWLGRRYYFDPEHTYVAPNHLIQGGCADIVRVAMNNIDAYLKDKQSRMLVQVHDELVFEIHKDEFEIVPVLQKFMEDAYPHKYLPLTCGPSYSWKSWADKVKGLPN